MHLGERIKQARLAAKLTQQQLCGTQITRNMLSQIENGSASPSMATLLYLAERLDRPVSWFLGEEAGTNGAILGEARRQYRSGDYAGVEETLEHYPWGDSAFDDEAALLRVHCCLELAKQEENGDARRYCRQARQWAEKCCYLSVGLQLELMLCQAWLCRKQPEELERFLKKEFSVLPEREQAQIRLLFARYFLKESLPLQAQKLLQAEFMENAQQEARCLQGDAYFALEKWEQAREAYVAGEKQAKPEEKLYFYKRLEQCCLTLEDYKGAYFYAKKQQK